MNLIRNLRTIRHRLVPALTFKKNLRSPANITVPNVLLEDCIWNKSNKWDDKTALVCAETNRSYTYGDLYKKTKTLAAFLHKYNKLKKSDTIAIVLPNVPEYPIIFLGIVQAGYVVTTVNPFFTAGEISRHLLQTNAKLVFTSSKWYTTVKQGLELGTQNLPVVLLKTEENSSLPCEALNYDDIFQDPCDIKLSVKHPEDTVMMAFSSGTTGLPKAIEISNRALVANLYQMMAPEFEVLSEATASDQEVVPLLVPMYHVYGMIIILLHSLIKGCKIVTAPSFRSRTFISILEVYKPTTMYLVPSIYQLMIKNDNIKSHHFLTTKSILSAAAPLGAHDIAALREKCQKADILQLYGLTETCACIMQSVHLSHGVKQGGIGFLLPLTEAKVISTSDGQEVGANRPGEILLRGPQVFKGYYKNDRANKETFTEDGWFKTGDCGYYDDDGHFFITDRIKNYIKVSGYPVSTVQLEEIIRQHPAVEDVAVIGVPHSKLGEAPKAFVVRKCNSTVTSSEIQEFVKNRVVNYMQLNGGVCFVDSIPKSSMGKISKNELKNW